MTLPFSSVRRPCNVYWHVTAPYKSSFYYYCYYYYYYPPSGPSLSGCRLPLLTSGTVTQVRHFCTLVACLPVTAQDSSLFTISYSSPWPCTLYSACAVTLVILDTLIVHVTYLLTYIVSLKVKAVINGPVTATKWVRKCILYPVRFMSEFTKSDVGAETETWGS